MHLIKILLISLHGHSPVWMKSVDRIQKEKSGEVTSWKNGDRLEMLAESGISGIECLDPPPLGNVSFEDAKKRVGEKIFIKGNIDPVHVMLHGTAADVKEVVSRAIAAGKPGGGYILSTACSIAPYTHREKVQLLVEVA